METSQAIAVITGSRADFGVLRSVIRAIAGEPALHLQLVVAGLHLLPDAPSLAEIQTEFTIAGRVPMQRPDATGRGADVAALGRGIAGFGELFELLNPQIVLVLGDRIEAFAAASAASVGGRLVAHIHGGDRAEGVADEAMRHAITKLSHIHFPATPLSAARLAQMGEHEHCIHTVGSPAIDDLIHFPPLSDDELAALGLDPAGQFVIILHHPSGLSDEVEHKTFQAILGAIDALSVSTTAVILAPNRDPGIRSIEPLLAGRRVLDHLRRPQFIGLLRRSCCLVGNSSAGLIEAAALRLCAVNIGPRQHGRERADNVIDVPDPSIESIKAGIMEARNVNPSGKHHYGAGHAGEQIAQRLAQIAASPPSLRKLNAY